MKAKFEIKTEQENDKTATDGRLFTTSQEEQIFKVVDLAASGAKLQSRQKGELDLSIYPLVKLADLLDYLVIKNQYEYINGCRFLKLRYLVDTQRKLWFAIEAVPNKKIPSHSQMADEHLDAARCVAAGNLLVGHSDTYSISSINNKSGDFEPSFDSVKWLLAILLKHENKLFSSKVSLAESLTIERVDKKGKPESSHVKKKSELKEELADLLQLDRLAEQPTDIKRIVVQRSRPQPSARGNAPLDFSFSSLPYLSRRRLNLLPDWSTDSSSTRSAISISSAVEELPCLNLDKLVNGSPAGSPLPAKRQRRSTSRASAVRQDMETSEVAPSQCPQNPVVPDALLGSLSSAGGLPLSHFQVMENPSRDNSDKGSPSRFFSSAGLKRPRFEEDEEICKPSIFTVSNRSALFSSLLDSPTKGESPKSKEQKIEQKTVLKDK